MGAYFKDPRVFPGILSGSRAGLSGVLQPRADLDSGSKTESPAVLTPAPQPQERAWFSHVSHPGGRQVQPAGKRLTPEKMSLRWTKTHPSIVCSLLYIHSPGQCSECYCIPKLWALARDWGHGQGRQCHRLFQKSRDKGRGTLWSRSHLPFG